MSLPSRERGLKFAVQVGKGVVVHVVSLAGTRTEIDGDHRYTCGRTLLSGLWIRE